MLTRRVRAQITLVCESRPARATRWDLRQIGGYRAPDFGPAVTVREASWLSHAPAGAATASVPALGEHSGGDGARRTGMPAAGIRPNVVRGSWRANAYQAGCCGQLPVML